MSSFVTAGLQLSRQYGLMAKAAFSRSRIRQEPYSADYTEQEISFLTALTG
jgi:hypothetical protein